MIANVLSTGVSAVNEAYTNNHVEDNDKEHADSDIDSSQDDTEYHVCFKVVDFNLYVDDEESDDDDEKSN